MRQRLQDDIDGFVQDYSNSIANALEFSNGVTAVLH